MRSGSWDYEVRARCQVSDAVALLTDVSRQGTLHPLVVAVREHPSAPGALRSWAVTDRLALGPVRFRITYEADLLSVSESGARVRPAAEVVTVARQRPRTSLRSTARITEDDGWVHVGVHVELTAPSLLFPYALSQGRSAHLQLAKRMVTALEKGPPTGREHAHEHERTDEHAAEHGPPTMHDHADGQT